MATRQASNLSIRGLERRAHALHRVEANLQRVIGRVTNGGGGMPPFEGTLTQRQINDVTAYVT